MVRGLSLIKYVLKHQANRIIDSLNTLDYKCRKYNLENDQWFINFQDKLNEISVR